MADNSPSSVICFKNGYSYVNIPVILAPNSESNINSDVKDFIVNECQVGPLPELAVHGTVSLEPHDLKRVKIFSLSQAAKKVIEPTPLKINTDGDCSYEKILADNIGTAVSMECLIQNEGSNATGTRTANGLIKSVHTKGEIGVSETGSRSLVVIKSLETRGGEKVIRCSSIVHLETIPRKNESKGGKDRLY